MKGAILIYKGNKTERLDKAKEFLKEVNPADSLQVETIEGKKSIGIEQVRQAINFIQTKPLSSDRKVLIIPEAERLTTEAQNALLKTLEEPPAYAVIILNAKTQDSLLPTVISRCQRIPVDSKSDENKEGRVGESIEKIKDMNIKEKMEWAQETAKEEKEDILMILEEWVREERKNLLKNPNSVNNIRLIIDVKEDLEKTNVNTRLSLDYLALHLI